MKTNILSRKSRTAAGLLWTLVWIGLGLSAQAQPFASPIGTWDLALGHAKRGVAYITFTANNLMSGYEHSHSKPVGTNTFQTIPKGTEVRGALIEGSWNFDQAGQVIGFYTENSTRGTNLISTPVSFVGRVKSGKKMSLTATVQMLEEDGGGVNIIQFLNGVPATNLPDISGSYYGKGRLTGALANEFFTLKSSSIFTNLPNIYDVEGQGADYDIFGIVLLSKTGKLSFYSQLSYASNEVLRVVSGPINLNKLTDAKLSTTLKGAQLGDSEDASKVVYQLLKQPVID